MLQSAPSAKPSCAKLIPSIGSSNWILLVQAGSRHLTKKSHTMFVYMSRWYIGINLDPMNVLCSKRKGHGMSLEPMIVLCLKGKGEMARPIALQRDDG